MFFACDEDETIDPKIETASVVVTSASSFTVKANIIAVGSIPVLDYGFIYSTYEYSDLFQGTKISLGANPPEGSYESNITIPNSGGSYWGNPQSYSVRAYLTNEKGTVYGAVQSFTFPVLSLLSVSPQQGKAGDLITIIGNNFSTEPSGNIVSFDDIPAVVKSASATQLTVEVPSGIPNYSYYYYNEVSIIITTGTQRVEFNAFRVLPDFKDFSPKSGTFGQTVTITGNNLYGHSYSILLGDVSVSGNLVTNTSMTFTIPSNVNKESFTINVIIDNDITVELPGEFSITEPVITSISPTTSISGALVTLSGSGFNTSGYYNNSNNTVWFGTEQASVSSASSTQVKVYVPANLTVGESYEVTLSTGVHTVTAPEKFTLGSPSIEDFSPKTASAGSYITITGTNFGNVNGTVLFGDEGGYIYSWTDKSIQVQVPSSYYLPDGSYKITVNAGGQSAVSEESVTIE